MQNPVASDSSSSNSENLRRPIKNFKCEICLKTFSSKHCLKEHGYTHTNEKPYKCGVCFVPFKHASQLSIHKKTHQVKPEVKYPNLTTLLSTYKATTIIIEATSEAVSIPLVNPSHSQDWVLPRFNSLRS